MDDIYNTNARFDKSNQIHETAIIFDNVEIGKGNLIGPYTVIGSNGEIRGCREFFGRVIIGNNNVISEHVTIQRPATKDAVTVIGDNNIIMAHAHVGHDVEIGSDCEICTGVIVGGYAKIKDRVKVKLGVTIRNRKTIGEGALIGLGSAVVKDVEAGTVVVGNPAKILLKS